jgi:hypothetical protein
MSKSTSKKRSKTKEKLLEALAKFATALVSPIVLPWAYHNDAYKKARVPDSENATPHDLNIDDILKDANKTYIADPSWANGMISGTFNGTVTGVMTGKYIGNAKYNGNLTDFYIDYTGPAPEVAKILLEHGDYGQAISFYKEAYGSLVGIPEKERNALLEQVKSGNVIVIQKLAELVKNEEEELIFNEARAGWVL